ncbi:MAG: TIGR02265 family protein [Myxococcota bacterium]
MTAAAKKHSSALELVGDHCDLSDRLPHVPPSARMRGLWFRIVAAEVKARGHEKAYRKFFPDDEFSSLRFYWTGDYLIRAAVGGALISGVENLHDGMFEISRRNASRFADSLFGRTLIRLLSPNPTQVVKQGIAARRQTITHGQWELVHAGDQTLQIQFREEYMWIESHVAGSWKGTFEAIGIAVDLDCDLSDRFNGTIEFRWPAVAATQQPLAPPAVSR